MTNIVTIVIKCNNTRDEMHRHRPGSYFLHESLIKFAHAWNFQQYAILECLIDMLF